MGYRIEYRPIKKVRGMEKRVASVPAMGGVFFLLFLLLVNSIWPQGSEALRGLLFSGDAAVTAAAMEEFAVDLKAGGRWSDALESFCRAVIGETEVASD